MNAKAGIIVRGVLGLSLACLVGCPAAGALSGDGSLWDEASVSLFTNRKAARIGDVVTVIVVEDASASNQTQLKLSKETSTDLSGQGSGKLFRDGRVYDIQWVRHDAQGANDRLLILDSQGNQIPLRPGTTWIQLTRPGANVQID